MGEKFKAVNEPLETRAGLVELEYTEQSTIRISPTMKTLLDYCTDKINVVEIMCMKMAELQCGDHTTHQYGTLKDKQHSQMTADFFNQQARQEYHQASEHSQH